MDDAVEPALRIHLLGQPRFFFQGEPYAFHSRPRALPLLAFLLLGCLRGWYSVRKKQQSVDVQIHTPHIREDIDKVRR